MIDNQRNHALAAEIDIGLVDQHRDFGMILDQFGDLGARQRDHGGRVGIGDDDRPRLVAVVLDPYAHFAVQWHALPDEAEQL